MNRRQRAIVIESLTVIAFTIVAVFGLINFKDLVNRSEAIKAMRQLGQALLEYRQKHGVIAPESYVKQIRPNIHGSVRLGELRYRGLFVRADGPADTILAYSRKRYPSSFLEDGYVVLFLDGTVKWMRPEEFEPMLAQQQTEFEKATVKP